MYKFPDRYNLGAPYHFIHPYKQRAVKKIVDNAPNFLDLIIIFGSAATPACYYESDIDVCLIGERAGEIKTLPMRTKGQTYDFLTYESIEEFAERSKTDKFNLENDIIKDGVIICDRKNFTDRPGGAGFGMFDYFT